MLCNMFRRKKSDHHKGCENISFIIQADGGRHAQNSYSSNWFSHDINLMSKDFNYVSHLIEKCIKLCAKPEINFKTNPPYLPTILRNFNNKIISIVKCYEHNLSELSEIYFFRVLIWTLMKQCKEILRIFRKAKADVCDELSIPHQKLIHVSFLLSYLFHSLVALFPNSYYAPRAFRITKADAAEWWYSHFGLSTTVVKWKDFFHVFSKINYVSNVSHIAALKKTINITGNGFVSIFDFDVFVRLFQPWESIIETWRIIAIEHPGCMPLLTYEQVIQILKSFKYSPGVGSYIFRFSCTKPGQWAIGYIDISGKIFQSIVHSKSLAIALCEGEDAGIYKYPNGKYFDSSIIRTLRSYPTQNVIVSQEEHEAYCRMDSTFEICKICELNVKNVRLEPCGHLLCDFCLSKWQKSFRYQGCPFCRFEIKGSERVSLVPFKDENESFLSNCHNSPPIPPRPSIDVSPSKLNYVKLDWLSLNDSGYCVDSTINDADDKIICESVIDERDREETVAVMTTSSLVDNAHYQNIISHNYLNDTVSSTSNDNSYNKNNPIALTHITDNSDAMKQLLKITGNDRPMSKEILRYFAPRPLAVSM